MSGYEVAIYVLVGGAIALTGVWLGYLTSKWGGRS